MEKAKKRSKIKIIAIILAVIILFFGVTILFAIKNTNKSLERIAEITPIEKEDKLTPERDENGYWTFTTDRDFKVVQLTDIHIGAGWLSGKKDLNAINAVATMVKAEKPDLVVITGDAGYPVWFQAGTLNNLSSAKIIATLMEQLGVYWTIGFGNHDTEAYSYYTREDISNFYMGEEWEHCIFETGPSEVDGYGNQVINVKNTKGIVTQSLFVFDSHSYMKRDMLGLLQDYDNIHENQVEWYEASVKFINEMNRQTAKKQGGSYKGPVKSSAFFHIPLVEQKDAWNEYVANNYQNTENVKFVYGVAGEGGKVVFSGMGSDNLFEKMLELDSTKAIFCGHDHDNNFSMEYKGIRFTYGMSVDYLAYPGISKRGSQRGCTVITYFTDGSFDCKSENYYQEKYQGIFEKETVVMQEVTNASFSDDYVQ